MEALKPIILNVKNYGLNPKNTISYNGFSIKVFHLPEDPDSANRIRISTPKVEVELLPSKGLSVSQAWINGQPVFWEAPINIPDTETLDLWSDEVCINGSPAPGFTFLKTLVGGIELYGLKNWGMPVEKDGKMELLHGETSNIPVDEVSFSFQAETCTVEASFVYRTFEGNSDLPWYERGEALFKVTKKIILTKGSLGFKLEDTIENISIHSLTPDWGYHITFRPEPGARYIVPASKAEYRGGAPLPSDYTIWQPSPDNKQRIEHGVIYKNFTSNSPEILCTSELIYPEGRTIKVKTTPAPYFQTWFCSGGAGSSEFTWNNGEPVFHRKWDGMGIEIGSSALDHNGSIDPSVVPEKALKPGESRQILIGIELVAQNR
jgi:hypothetical protein